LQIRNRLHLLQKRKTDQICFENQEKLARGLGFTDGDNGILAVEKFMQAYYTVASQVKLVTENVIHKIQTREKGALSSLFDRIKSRNLDENFRLLENQVSVKKPQVFDCDPHQLMTLFRHVQKTGLEVHFATKEAVKVPSLNSSDSTIRITGCVNAGINKAVRPDKKIIVKSQESWGFLSASRPPIQ
jgi:[protein-PII] uridylyltransferase